MVSFSALFAGGPGFQLALGDRLFSDLYYRIRDSHNGRYVSSSFWDI
jgi:hypothetical protein